MTEAEKLVVARLLMAIDDYRKPQGFTIQTGRDLDACLTETAQVREARTVALDRAIAAARELLDLSDH